MQKCLSIHNQPGGVVVPRGFGISVGLQNWVGGHNLVLEGDLLGFLLGTTGACGHHGQVGDHLLGVLSLSGSRLASDQHGVVLLVLEHVPVGALCDGPQVRGALVPPLAWKYLIEKVKKIFQAFLLTKINLAHPVGVERVTLVGVDNNNEETLRNISNQQS